MILRKLAVRNFRRLRDIEIDLASDISIFVGANNSGKTSVGHALQLFTGRGRFDIHDFSAELWSDITAFGDAEGEGALSSVWSGRRCGIADHGNRHLVRDHCYRCPSCH